MNRKFLALGFLGGAALSLVANQYVSGCGTFFQTAPLLLFAWPMVAKLFGGHFADTNHWLVYGVATTIHGVFFMTIIWLSDYVLTFFLNKSWTVRTTSFGLLFIIYAILLLFAFPLKDCP